MSSYVKRLYSELLGSCMFGGYFIVCILLFLSTSECVEISVFAGDRAHLWPFAISGVCEAAAPEHQHQIVSSSAEWYLYLE